MDEQEHIAPALRVSDEKLVGARIGSIIDNLQRGVGQPLDYSDQAHRRGSLAVALDQSHSASTGGLRTYLGSDVGRGYWDFIESASGLYAGVTDAYYKHPYHLQLPTETMVKIRIIVSGAIHLEGEEKSSGAGTARIHSLSSDSRLSYRIQPGALEMVTLHITPAAIQRMGIHSETLHAAIVKASGKYSTIVPSVAIEPAGPLLEIAQSIIGSRDSVPAQFRLTYIAGKTRELLTEALSSLFFGSPTTSSIERQVDKKLAGRLHEARRILESTTSNPPSIEQLSRMVGVNRTTLKATFKTEFGSTIHEYQMRLRMVEAKRLLQQTELQVGEIAEQLGFAQLSHFSNTVRKHLGSSPREIRKHKAHSIDPR